MVYHISFPFSSTMNEDILKRIRNHIIFKNDTFVAIIDLLNFKRKIHSTLITLPMKNGSLIDLRFYDDFVQINEPYETNNLPIFVNYQSFVFEPLQDFILRCLEFGIIDIFESNYTHLLNQNSNVYYEEALKKSESEPKVLTMQMLEAGFVLWIALIPLSFIVFIGEHVVRYNSKRRRRARREKRIANRKMLEWSFK